MAIDDKAEDNAAQIELSAICQTCGKPKQQSRKRSITGWIFEEQYTAMTDRWACLCEKIDEVAYKNENRSSGETHESNIDDRLHTVIGDRWLLTERIGTGPIGATYEASEKAGSESALVKLTNRELSANPRIVKRFLQEGKKAQALIHPNILHVIESGMMEDGSGFLVYEHYRGQSLREVIDKEGFLDVEEALLLGIAVCDALEVAHKQDILHRGVKPTNIIFWEDEVKLMDFGIDKALPTEGKEARQLTRTQSCKFASPDYSSPEQCLGEQLTPQSDIYSLGVVLYEALTGKRPFKGKNGLLVACQHIMDEPPAFKKIMFNCDIPQTVETVVRQMLCKEPNDRYKSVEDLRDDLELLLAHKTPRAQPKPFKIKAISEYGQVLAPGKNRLQEKDAARHQDESRKRSPIGTALPSRDQAPQQNKRSSPATFKEDSVNLSDANSAPEYKPMNLMRLPLKEISQANEQLSVVQPTRKKRAMPMLALLLVLPVLIIITYVVLIANSVVPSPQQAIANANFEYWHAKQISAERQFLAHAAAVIRERYGTPRQSQGAKQFVLEFDSTGDTAAVRTTDPAIKQAFSPPNNLDVYVPPDDYCLLLHVTIDYGGVTVSTVNGLTETASFDYSHDKSSNK